VLTNYEKEILWLEKLIDVEGSCFMKVRSSRRKSHKIRNIVKNVDVLLTVHLSVFILVINQLDAQNCCFTLNLFHASTCFEHHVLIIRRSKLYYTASGITRIGGRPCARDGHLKV